MWPTSADQSCECCAPYFEPTEMRMTSGIFSRPADMACHLAGLVYEDLVARAAEEVAVHQLDDGAAARERDRRRRR